MTTNYVVSSTQDNLKGKEKTSNEKCWLTRTRMFERVEKRHSINQIQKNEF